MNLSQWKKEFTFLHNYMWPYRLHVVLAIIFLALGLALEHLFPRLLSLLIDGIKDGAEFSSLLWIFAVLAGASISAFFFLHWQHIFFINTSRKVEWRIRNDLFQQIIAQPRRFFDKQSVGDLMARSTSDITHVQELIGPGQLHFTRTLLYLIFTAIMLFSIHSGIAVLGLSVSLVLPWLSMRFMRYNYSAFYENQNSLARLNSFVQETLGGISLIRSYGQEKHFQQQFEQRSTEFRSRNKIIARQSSLIWPVINLVSGFGVVAALAYGVHLVQNEQMTIGELSAALLYLIKLQFPLVGMGWGLYIVQQGRASLNRILELTEKMHTHTSGPVVSLHNPSVQKLEWKNLDFHYPEKKELILKDISFSLEPGKVLGICGETASGKSTLARVLSGIYSPPENAFYINDTDMSLQAASQRMSFFAFAPQESFLFSTSIRENIAMGIRNSHSLSIEEASRLAGLEQDLAQLENGLDTILGEKGVNLSGGQKQRVGLARALITQAPVLILDDVLSAVDNETEKKIIANLRSHLDKNTALIISHRYSALELCHEILYMSEGKIIERGSHQELLALNGFYAHNYRIQSLQEKEYD